MTDSLTVTDLRELTDSWQVTLRAQGKTRETIRVYLRNVEQYLAFVEATGKDPLSRRSVEAFIADMLDRGREGLTARGRLTAVKAFGRWLVDADETEADPYAGIKPPRIDEKIVTPLTAEQIRALLATCKTPRGATPERKYVDARDEALIRLMVETGLRAGEVLSLTLEDVQWKADPPFLVVEKAKARRGRTVPFSAQSAQALGAYLRLRRHLPIAKATDALWLGARGRVLAYNGLYDLLERRATQAGIEKVHPHMFRHTAAERWLSKGGSEGGLMTMAGWSRPEMLHRYSRARAEQRAAEEAARLDLGSL